MSLTESPSRAILERDAAHNSGLWQPDIAFVRGEGVKLWDADGNEYLDCMAGIAVASIGHANERLSAALSKQAHTLIVCPQNLGNDTRAMFLERLASVIPAELTRIFLASSGSEINEAALKWARAATGRTRFVAAKRGFSGRTMGALSLTWEPKYREPFAPLRYEADFVRYNQADELEAAIDEETAAVFLEPVQGEGGIHPASQKFLRRARDIAHERGALLIFDEVQSGVGRTGKFLACQHYDVIPDMVTLAKGLGGGVPIAALLMREAVAQSMPKGGHGTTFGGNPLAAAAGLAVLEEFAMRDILAHVKKVGNRLRKGVLAMRLPKVRSVRGVGLFIGIELKQKAAPYIAALRDQGVLTINAGATVIRLVPPLIISEAEVDAVLQRLEAVLQQDLRD